jgi:hypothetical protein
MQKLLNDIFPEAEYIDNGYYSFLLSPKGSPMQFDRYYPDLKLAFEMNGRQHYTFNQYLHQTKEAFEYLQQCDRLKAKLAKKRGIHLVAIKYDRELSHGYLIRRLREEGILDELKKRTVVRDDLE